MVPVDNPRFAMAVVINDPTSGCATTAASSSAPVFHNVMEGALRLMDVPPDNIETWLAAQAAAEKQAATSRAGERRRRRDASAATGDDAGALQ